MGEPTSRRFSLLRAIPLLLAATIVVAAGLWGAGMRLAASPFWSDAAAYSQPKYQLVAERLGEGALPLWNPYEFCGIPLLATIQPAAVYPPVWLAYGAFGGDLAYRVFVLLHLALGSLFALALARSLGCGLWASMLAALWVTNPLLLVRAYDHPVLLAGVVWVPLLLLLARKTLLQPSARTAAALGSAAAVQVASGYPPMVLATGYVLLFGLPFWLLEIRRHAGRATLARAAAALIAAGFVAALLAALQVLPTAELSALTTRSSVGPLSIAVEKQLGASARAALWWAGLPPPNPWIGLVELGRESGPLVLALAALGLALRPSAPAPWHVVLIACLCTLVPYNVITLLPLYGFVRFALEWTYMSPLFLYLAAALGLQAAQRRWKPATVILVIFAFSTLAITTAWSGAEVQRRGFWSVRSKPAPELPEVVERACGVGPGRARIFWPAGQSHAVLLQRGIASVAGYEQALLLERVDAVRRALGIPSGGDNRQWAKGMARHPSVVSRMGLRCAVTLAPQPALEQAGFVRLSDTHPPHVVYTNEAALPRARLVSNVRVAESPERALELLLSESLDPATTVILEGDASALPRCRPGQSASAEITDHRPEEVRIRVETPCRAYLLLADTHAPGWVARVDGQERPIAFADYLFRAVLVEPGEHEVVFRYRPGSVRVGGWLTVLGLAACALLVAIPARRDPLR